MRQAVERLKKVSENIADYAYLAEATTINKLAFKGMIRCLQLQEPGALTRDVIRAAKQGIANNRKNLAESSTESSDETQMYKNLFYIFF